jgi:hypothetical protein
LQTSNYIDENPVKAGLVKEAKEWELGGVFHRLYKIFSYITEPDKWMLEDIPIPILVS